MLSVWLVLLLLAAAPEDVPPAPGRLCIGDACAETAGTTIAVKPESRERRFFWLSADAKTAYAGVIAPKAETVVLDPEKFSALDVLLEGDATRGWPLEVKLSLAVAPEQQWTVTLDAEEAKRLRRLYVPDGTYYSTADVEHHQTHYARVVAGAKPAKLEIRLVPLLLARGVVVDAEDKPIARASIAFPDGKPCATANDQGAFTCELSKRLPRALVIGGSGYVAREVPIVKDGDFGRVRLSKGRLLTLRIVQPEAKAARVSLFRDVEVNDKHTKLKTVSIQEREETVRFDTGEGKHFIVVEGDGPLERLEVPVTVKDLDLEQEIRIEPFRLLGSVRFGEDPMEGTVELVPFYSSWRERLPLHDGTFAATMWQSGKLGAWVSGPEVDRSEFFESPQLGEDPSRWDMHLEKRMIAGRVFDAITRAPVPETAMEVSVEVSSEAGNTKSTFTTDVRPDSTYRIMAREPGTYVLRFNSRQHLPHSVEFRVTGDQRTVTHDVALESGVLQPVDVISPGGAPIARALLLEGERRDGLFSFNRRTDERGHYELRGLPGQTLVLTVVPEEGSFAVARVQFPQTNAEARPLQIVVPPAAGSLRVRSVSADGKPLWAGLLIRHNGHFVSDTVFRHFAGRETPASTGTRVFSRLPAGTYEIWALESSEDASQLLASAGTSRQPVRVGLSSGEQEVTVVAPGRLGSPRQRE